jgi:replicative DNA helicase
MMDNKVNDLNKVTDLINRYQENFMPKETIQEIKHDVASLLHSTRDVSKYKWNLKGLRDICPGIGPSTFSAIFALVETGKTAFLISTLFAPKGFMAQGAKVMILGNEEPVERTALRAVSSFTGMTDAQITADTVKAHNMWDVYRNQCVFLNTDEVPSMEELDQLIAKHKPDVVGIDQLDKMQIGGNYARDDIRLGEIYRSARTLSKKHSCAIIGVSQANAEADGRTVLRFTQMAGSRVGKAAEADLIVGIGKEQEDSGEDNKLRHIYVSKNKLGGKHGTCTTVIEPEVSRYVD